MALKSVSFKSVFKAFRAAAKPGMLEPPPPSSPVHPYGGQNLQSNENGDAVCDLYGSQWVRESTYPNSFRDSINPFGTTSEGVPFKQLWERAFAVDHLYIGQDSGVGRPCALYNLDVQFGDPAIPWATSPYYVQLFTPNNGVAPSGRPDWCMPVAREGSSYSFGVNTPFNGVSGTGGGIAIAFSVTRDVYTSPGGVLGFINANWAYYSYSP